MKFEVTNVYVGNEPSIGSKPLFFCMFENVQNNKKIK